MSKVPDEVKKFAIFAMEEYRSRKNLSGSAAYSLFTKTGLLNYIEEFYDILHSNGAEYLICDIDDYLANHLSPPLSSHTNLYANPNAAQSNLQLQIVK